MENAFADSAISDTHLPQRPTVMNGIQDGATGDDQVSPPLADARVCRATAIAETLQALANRRDSIVGENDPIDTPTVVPTQPQMYSGQGRNCARSPEHLHGGLVQSARLELAEWRRLNNAPSEVEHGDILTALNLGGKTLR
jgi:hypothetical protein